MNPLVLAAIGYFLWQNQKKKAASTTAVTSSQASLPVSVGGKAKSMDGDVDINDQYAWMYDSDRTAN